MKYVPAEAIKQVAPVKKPRAVSKQTLLKREVQRQQYEQVLARKIRAQRYV